MLGRSHSVLAEDPAVLRVYRRVFGIEDFHSHLRWHAIKRYVDPHAGSILEVGAHSGLITHELAAMRPGARIVASELDEEALDRARRTTVHLTNIEWSQADLTHLATEPESFDQAFAIDVLEHIEDDQTAIAQLAAAVRPEGTVVLSTPTPNYPEVFGREFHDRIGHVRDGYWGRDLGDLVRSAGLRVLDWHYYTGRIGSWFASLYYQDRVNRKALLPILPAAIGVSLLEERRDPGERGASVAMLARKIS